MRIKHAWQAPYHDIDGQNFDLNTAIQTTTKFSCPVTLD